MGRAGAGALRGSVLGALFIGVNLDQCEKATSWFLFLAVPFKLNGLSNWLAVVSETLFFPSPAFAFCKVQPQIAPASLGAQMVENLPAMWETWVQSLDWEDPLEKGMATHSSIVA